MSTLDASRNLATTRTHRENRGKSRRRRRWFAFVLGAGWLGALVGVIAVTLSTRSEYPGTQDSIGEAIVIATAPAILLAACCLRRPVGAVLTVTAAMIASGYLAVSILNDESSTAAVGLIVVPFPPLFIVGFGIVMQLLVISSEAKEAARRASPPTTP